MATEIKLPAGFAPMARTDSKGEKYLTKPGDTLTGRYDGTVSRNVNGEEVDGFKFTLASGEEVTILDRVRLRVFLRACPVGSFVFIGRKDPVKVNERSVNDYIIGTVPPFEIAKPKATK